MIWQRKDHLESVAIPWAAALPAYCGLRRKKFLNLFKVSDRFLARLELFASKDIPPTRHGLSIFLSTARPSRWIFKDPDLLRELDKNVIPSINKAGKLQNTLVHARWGVAAEYPDALIHLPVFGHQIAYEESDFRLAAESIAAAIHSVGQFDLKVPSGDRTKQRIRHSMESDCFSLSE